MKRWRACWHTHEEVFRVGRVAAHAEELHEIMELTVDVTAYLATYQLRFHREIESRSVTHRHWRRDCHDITLLDQELSRLVAYLADLGFGDRLAGA